MWKLLHKNEIYGQNQASEGGKVVPLQRLATEEYCGEQCKDYQRYNLLHHFELHQREWASVTRKPYSVGGYLARIFSQSDAPREYYDEPQGPRRYEFHLLQLQVAVPRKCHKDVRYDEQQYSIKYLHLCLKCL